MDRSYKTKMGMFVNEENKPSCENFQKYGEKKGLGIYLSGTGLT
jgi:hypothetical protein